MPAQVFEVEKERRIEGRGGASIGTNGVGREAAALEVEWDFHRPGGSSGGSAEAGPWAAGRAGVTAYRGAQGGRVQRLVFWVLEPDGHRRTVATYGPGVRFEERCDRQGAIRSLDVWSGGAVLRVSVRGDRGAWARSVLPELLGLSGGQYHLHGVRVADYCVSGQSNGRAERRETA